MRTSTTTIQGIRAGITVVLAVLMLLMPLSGLAQDATPTEMDPATELTAESAVSTQVAAMPGSLQVTLTSSTGLGLSGSVAVTDSAGVYQEVWVSEGFGQAASLAAGTATVTQLTGTTDYAIDATPKYIEIPEGGIGYATITNAFLDADGDGVGDSVDACPAGNDAIDTDTDGIADACDDTPNGDPIPSATTEPTPTAPVEPTATATTASTPVAGPMSRSAAVTPAQAMSYVSSASISPTSVTLKDRPTFTVTITNQGSGRLGSARILMPTAFEDPLVQVVGEATGSGSVGGDHRWTASRIQDGGLHIELTAQSEDSVLAPGGFVTVSFTAVPHQGAGTYTFSTRAWSDRERKGNSFSITSQPAVTVNDRVTNCGMVSTSNTTPVNGYVIYRCSTNASDIRIDIDSLTGTWKWAYIFSDSPNLEPPAFTSLDWLSSDVPRSADSEGRQHVFIFFTPTTAAPVGPWNAGQVSFHIRHPNTAVSYTQLTHLWTSFIRNIGPGDFSLTCNPAEVMPTAQTNAIVTCEIKATSSSASGTVTMSLPALEGWKVTTTNALTGTVTSTSPLRVTFTIAQAGSAPGTSGSVQVTSSLSIGGQTITGPTGSFTIKASAPQLSITDFTATKSVFGGTTNLSAKVSPAGVNGTVEFKVNGTMTPAPTYNVSTGVATLTGFAHGLAASDTPYRVEAIFTPAVGSKVTKETTLLVEHEPLRLSNLSAEMSWTHPYSFDDFTQTGWIEYTVSGTAEKGWAVQVTASEFGHSGGGKPIPADSLHFATASTTPGAGIETPATSGSLGSGPIVLSGSGETPPGPYTQTLDLTMNVPGGTLVGIYVSTITITAAAAP